MTMPLSRKPRQIGQSLVALAVLATALFLAGQAVQLKTDAGYAGVGPAFLPWCLSAGLGLCGLLLLRQAWRSGFAHVDPPKFVPHWRALTWLCASMLFTAATLTQIGFVIACAFGYGLAVRGLHHALGEPVGNVRRSVLHVLIGLCLAWAVYLIFSQLLGVRLPGLTATGWL